MITLLALLLSQQPPASTPPPADSPVGHWIADHPTSAIPVPELWFVFRPDNTVTVTAGIIVRSHWTLDGNALTVAPTPNNPKPDIMKVQFSAGKLLGTPAGDPSLTLTFARVGQPTTADPNIVGVWRLEHASNTAEPGEAATFQSMIGALFAYNADGTSETRIPIDVTTGHWSPATHTYTLPNHPALPFHRSGTTLSLTPPTDDQPHPYHPDPVSTP